MLSWANPLGARPTESPVAGPRQEAVRDEQGVAIVYRDGGTGPAGLRGTFAIAAAADDGVVLGARARFDARFDRDLWADFAADGRLTGGDDAVDRRPALAGESIGGAVSATVTLEPGETRTIRFAVAWDLPVTEFGGGRRWWKRHTRTWGRTGGRALDLARHALAETPAWRAAIEAWQRPVIEDESLPAWYRAALFNELYFLVDGGTFWEAGEVGGPEPEPDDPGPVRAPRVPRLPVLRHGRRRLLRVGGDGRAVPRPRAARDPRPAGDGGRAGHDTGDDRGVGPAGDAQGGVRRAARRRRPGRGPVRAGQPLPVPGRQRLDRPRAEAGPAGLARRRAARRRRAGRGGTAGRRGGAPAARDPGHGRRRAAGPRGPPRPDV